MVEQQSTKLSTRGILASVAATIKALFPRGPIRAPSYWEGYHAFEDRNHRNQHPPGSKDHADWNEGFEKALDDGAW